MEKHLRKMNLGGREIVFKSVVGSNNYNLADINSDTDYKLFTLPTFDDLYNKEEFSEDYISDEVDIDVHDVRKLDKLWYKANVNFLEVLFSDEIEINQNLSNSVQDSIKELLEMKDDIARMNLPYLYNACLGMCANKGSKLKKATSGTEHLLMRYGYDTKQAQHCYRILDFLQRFKDTNFTNFKRAITYKDGTEDKKDLMMIKGGYYTFSEFNDLMTLKYKRINNIEGYYTNAECDNETRERVKSIIYRMVRDYIKGGY